MRDQHANTALLLRLSQFAEKPVSIDGAYKLLHFCWQIIEWSRSGVEQKSGKLQLFYLSKNDHVRF